MQFKLHKLIGRNIKFNNQFYVLIEAIEEKSLLIFQSLSKKEIQQDQHGNANRRSPPTFTIHCLNESKTDLHPVLKELLNDIEQEQLKQKLII